MQRFSVKKLSGRGCSGIPCAADEPGRDAQRWFSFMEKAEMEIVSEEFRALWDLIYLLEERAIRNGGRIKKTSCKHEVKLRKEKIVNTPSTAIARVHLADALFGNRPASFLNGLKRLWGAGKSAGFRDMSIDSYFLPVFE